MNLPGHDLILPAVRVTSSSGRARIRNSASIMRAYDCDFHIDGFPEAGIVATSN